MRSFASMLLLVPLALPVHGETFKGQVVCSNCWDEADRKTIAYGTPADLKCAARCEKNNVPAVEIRGSLRQETGKSALKVDALELLPGDPKRSGKTP